MSFSTIPSFTSLLNVHASQARYFRSSDRSEPCLCQTPEKFRDPEFHLTFSKYGPQSAGIANGVIPGGAVLDYMFVASNGVRMAPACSIYGVTSATNFSVVLQLAAPPVGEHPGLDAGNWEIYRRENGGPWYLLEQILASAVVYNDNHPLYTGPTPPPFVAPVVCNEAGMISLDPVDLTVKAFVQPIQSTRATRLSTEYLQEVFGNIEADDHLGIFPVNWSGQRLEFQNWSQSGDDFIEYENQRYFVVNANMIPDPGDGNPEHHWELGLRVIRSDGLAG